jgi:peptide/nickel transport system substrate-binding protein
MQYMSRSIDRRGFLRLVGLGAGGTAALSLMSACVPAAPSAPTAAPAQATAAPAAKPTTAPAAAPTAAPAQAKVAPTGKITVAQPAEFLYMDPQVSFFSSEASMHYSIFDSVIRRADDMKLVPSLATSWKATAPTEWTLELRTGVKFHNGEPFNAEVMKWNVERMTEAGANRSPFLQDMTNAEVVNASTIKITTKRSDPTFPARMTMFFIMPPDYVKQAGPEGILAKPVGSGPYTFVERVKDSHLTMEANPDWWGGAPKIKTVTWKVLPQASTRVAALKAGELDLVPQVSTDQFDELNADPKLRAVWVRSVRTPMVMMAPESPQGGGEPLRDQRVRQALNYAVNADAIVQFLLGGKGERTATLMTQDFLFYDQNVKPYPYDQARAKQLLTEAGYPNGFELNFDVPSSGISIKPVELAQAISADLAKVGVKANVQPQEFATAVKLRDERKIAPLFLWSWGGSTLDPDDKFWGVQAKDSTWSFIIEEDTDKLIQEGRTSVDDSRRKTIYEQLQAKTKDQAPFIFLFAQPDVYAQNRRLTWEARNDERIFLWNAELKS